MKMKNKQPKRHWISGILLGLGAAYLWAVLMFSFYAVQEDWFGFGVLFAAGYAVTITSWFVVPIGATLGSVLPEMVTQKSRGEALFRGAIAGIICGLTAAIFTVGVEQWPYVSGTAQIVDATANMRSILIRFARNAVSMALVSSLCVAGWAYTLNKKAEQCDPPNG